jgi:hypothetical protein
VNQKIITDLLKTNYWRGSYKQSGGAIIEHYVFLPEKKEDRVKFLNDIIEKATGTYPGNLSIGWPFVI